MICCACAGQRNVMITSALPYVNNVPHLGNIIGCVLSADCYARFCRSRGYNCIYICGTDEYGTATETKALEEGVTPQQICDKYHKIHAEIYQWFDIGFDHFGRTPTWQQTEIAQALFKRLEDTGQLQEQTIEQLYSEAAGKFLADRFVTGTCPKCGYEDARGDQCDSCGNLLNPTELIRPKCALTGTTPVVRQTRHMFLDLPELQPKLQEYITRTSQAGGWSSNCVQTTNAWMRDGLKQRCITRDLKWGTPVPHAGYEDKVLYVWFDAPVGYISITANYVADWQAWWQNPDDVELVQFMGKDNVPFHTVIFPASLLGTDEQWTLMKCISVTEYLNYEGGKFSKSRGTGVFGNDAQSTGIPSEVWRYYLLSNRPEQSDTDFKWSDLVARNNSELLANLGNFINRALSFAFSKLDGGTKGAPAPAADSAGMAVVQELGEAVHTQVQAYIAAMEARKIREGSRLAMAVSSIGNKFFQDNKPWTLLASDMPQCKTLLAACLGLVVVLGALVAPYMPSVTVKVQTFLNLPPTAFQLTDSFVQATRNLHTLVSPGHKLNKPEVLFRNISEEEQAALYESKSSATAAAKTAQAASQTAANGIAKEPKVKPAKQKATAKSAAEDKPVDISRVDLRVGLIVKASKHPDADSLYVEDIDCGEAQPRQASQAGLVKFIPEAEMQNRLCVVVANLKPANMKGIKSHAMVLAASSADGEKVELVEPPAGSKPGERVSVTPLLEDPPQPDEQLNPKKKIFEMVAADLKTSEELVACYKEQPLATSRGVCKVRSIAGGGIK
eukprot:jgi/Astpho2/8560/e_gw1.00125.5.1_t